jgi:hypothetical protein
MRLPQTAFERRGTPGFEAVHGSVVKLRQTFIIERTAIASSSLTTALHYAFHGDDATCGG